jgi:cytochrome bd-type quinol oxidase subunit 2
VNDAPQIIIYLLCFFASVLCAMLLLRGFQRSRVRLLLWSGLCFGFLSLNNLAVLFDLLIVAELDLQMWRHLASFAAVSVLLVGLVLKSE